MELKLQKYVYSLIELSNSDFIDPLNFIIFTVQRPVDNIDFLIYVGHTEPTPLGIPNNCLWIVTNPLSSEFGQILKYQDPSVQSTAPDVWVPQYSNWWVRQYYYGDIFANVQTTAHTIDYSSIIANSLVLVRALQPYRISVTGPSNVYSGSSANQFQSYVVLNNTNTVTPTVNWSLAGPGAAGSVISSNGSLTAGSTVAPESITIEASYTHLRRTVTTSYSATIQPILPVSLAISGSSSITSGTNSNYTVAVTFNDSSGLNVTTSSTWSCDTNVGSISNTGILTPATVSSNATGLVYASYTSNGATVNTQYSVTVHPAANTLYPYYGVADMNATKNSAFILALASRGSNSSRVVPSFSLNSGSAGSTLKGYFASPVSYGFVTFTDLANGLQGGWDGAKNNPTNMSMLGPITISVPVNGVNIDFYLYGNDWPGLGTITWGTS